MTKYIPAVGDLIELKNGRRCVLEDINPNPNWAADNETWGEGSSSDGYWDVEILDPEGITLVMRKEMLASRTLPTVDEIRSLVRGAVVGGGWGPLEVNEGQNDGDRDIEFFGETEDGLEFGFSVRVGAIEGVEK